MSYFSDSKFKEEILSYVNSWKKEKLIFSYLPRLSVEDNKIILQLKQEETNFSIEMIIEEDVECLRLLSFNLIMEDILEQISETLYDASFIEIILQTLEIIYFYAHYKEKSGVTFMLVQEEANYIKDFKYIFSTTSSVNTAMGARDLLTMHTLPYNYEEFLSHSESIKKQVLQKSWRFQKSDPFLKRFLQLPSKEKKELLHNIFGRAKNFSS